MSTFDLLQAWDKAVLQSAFCQCSVAICGALAACFGVLGACDLTRLNGHAKAWIITLVFIQACFFPEGPKLTDSFPDAACQCLHLQGIYSFGALGRFHLSPSPPRPMGPQGFMGLLLFVMSRCGKIDVGFT